MTTCPRTVGESSRRFRPMAYATGDISFINWPNISGVRL